MNCLFRYRLGQGFVAESGRNEGQKTWNWLNGNSWVVPALEL